MRLKFALFQKVNAFFCLTRDREEWWVEAFLASILPFTLLETGRGGAALTFLLGLPNKFSVCAYPEISSYDLLYSLSLHMCKYCIGSTGEWLMYIWLDVLCFQEPDLFVNCCDGFSFSSALNRASVYFNHWKDVIYLQVNTVGVLVILVCFTLAYCFVIFVKAKLVYDSSGTGPSGNGTISFWNCGTQASSPL